MEKKQSIAAAVVVAHPDDETLWAGGTILPFIIYTSSSQINT